MNLTDNEIIKALEYCNSQGITSECEKCKVKKGCRSELLKNALDLINRQNAEIEKLTKDINTANSVIKNTFLLKAGVNNDPFVEIKAEAIKEFAEKIKAYFNLDNSYDIRAHIDNLVKEMVGETE